MTAYLRRLIEDERFARYFRIVAARHSELGMATMLSDLSSKMGKGTAAFNLSMPLTCCSDLDIASPLCRAHCWVYKMMEGRSEVGARAGKNYYIATRDDFAELVTGAISIAKVNVFKIHGSGDFFCREYIDAWVRIVERLPEVKFYAYSRAWVRPEFIPALGRLAALPNMLLLLSFDNAMPIPPKIPHTETAWLALHDKDVPPKRCLIAFRASTERTTISLKTIRTTPVCPQQNPHSVKTFCIDCRICLP